MKSKVHLDLVQVYQTKKHHRCLRNHLSDTSHVHRTCLAEQQENVMRKNPNVINEVTPQATKHEIKLYTTSSQIVCGCTFDLPLI